MEHLDKVSIYNTIDKLFEEGIHINYWYIFTKREWTGDIRYAHSNYIMYKLKYTNSDKYIILNDLINMYNANQKSINRR